MESKQYPLNHLVKQEISNDESAVGDNTEMCENTPARLGSAAKQCYKGPKDLGFNSGETRKTEQ